MKRKLIKTRMTIGLLAFMAVAGGIFGAVTVNRSEPEKEASDTITAEIISSEDEALTASADKNAPPMVPDIKKAVEEKITEKKSQEKPAGNTEEKTEENTGSKSEPEAQNDDKTEENKTSVEAFDPYSEETEDVWADEEFSLMWPLEGETLLAYSADRTVYDSTLDQFRTNNSIWIAAQPGDIVRAAESGVVESAESLPASGNTVTLYHDNGWRTTYGQLESLLVLPGEEIAKGEIIGYVGQTTKYGANQGDHLEFSVFVEGESVDPKVAVEG